jgi:CheY-like chemotaxis protein
MLCQCSGGRDAADAVLLEHPAGRSDEVAADSTRRPPGSTSVERHGGLPPGRGGGADVIRVLVVTHDWVLAEDVQRVLVQDEDLVVVGIAGGAADAVRSVADLTPDVVVLDRALPDADLCSMAARVQDARPDTAVLLAAGWRDDKLLPSAVETGCAGAVSLAEPGDVVAAAVRAAAGGHRAAGRAAAWQPGS